MAEQQDQKAGSATGEKRGKDARAERLAAALRANLKRRKQQARARASDDRPAGGKSVGD